jgi:hypothetical protein
MIEWLEEHPVSDSMEYQDATGAATIPYNGWSFRYSTETRW